MRIREAKDNCGGWVIDPEQLEEVARRASDMESVSMEEAEAVICALADLGVLQIAVDGANDYA